ncbi:MAG: SAM-dependent methyltransferase [Oscillospiraceae bacterium]|nr:SAM-dependent methyltransferase [Oscillospiraceae bacterium]
MNKRLLAIASLVGPGLGLVDVGTDHGALPIHLAQSGYPGTLLATDIHEGPLRAGIRNAEAAGLSHRVRFLLCDGLELCPPDEIDTIVIAGMGGDTICGILDRAEWTMDPRYTLILQPMTRFEVLRYWLTNNGYGIEQEHLVEDSGTIYQILTARFGIDTVLSDAELFTGASQLIRRDPLWPCFRERSIQRFERMIAGMQAGGREPGKRALLESILEEWKGDARNGDRT